MCLSLPDDHHERQLIYGTRCRILMAPLENKDDCLLFEVRS